MGTYTELVLKVRLRDDLPVKVKRVLAYLCADGELPDLSELPEHPFFKTPNWNCIGTCSSFLFLDWINPYLDENEGQCIGWEWYEKMIFQS